MTRLIDADALTMAVLKKAFDDAFLNGNTDMHKLLISVVAHQPTIDAVPVIRCKDCRYWSSEDGKSGYCNGFNLVYRKYDADYYCATAEHIEHDD